MPDTRPSARPLTVEEFLRREAVKKREAGIEDGDNTALSALESLEKGSSNFDKTSAEKRNSRKAAYQKFNGPARWKVQYKEEEADELGDPDSSEVEDAKEKAISMLNRRHVSAFVLRNKLSQYGFSANAVRAAVERMQEVGLQNDLEYAEAFARVRWHGFKWGPDRVKRALKMKGISTADQDTAVRSVYGDRADALRVSLDAESEDGEPEEPSEEDVSVTVEKELYAAARRHFLAGDASDANRRWKRTADWLARRGFNWATASSIMVALKAEPGVWKRSS